MFFINLFYISHKLHLNLLEFLLLFVGMEGLFFRGIWLMFMNNRYSIS